MKIKELAECIENGLVVEKIDEIFELLETGHLIKRMEEEEIENILVEIKLALEDEKEFDKLLELIDLLKTKQKSLYDDYHYIFDDFLVDYHCFRNEFDLLESDFSYHVSMPDRNFTKLLISFKKALCYQQIGTIENIIRSIYPQIVGSEELIGDETPYDLAIVKYYSIIQSHFIGEFGSKKLDQAKLKKELAGYGFDLGDESLRVIQLALFSSEDEIGLYLKENADKEEVLFLIECLFLKAMLVRGFSFSVSGMIWANFTNFLIYQQEEKKSNTNKEYLIVDGDLYRKYLLGVSTYNLNDNISEMIAVVWGAVYIYDFFDQIGIVDKETYGSFQNITRGLKGEIISSEIFSLWRHDFVHSWNKPDSISEAEFEHESAIFKMSIELPLLTFSENKLAFEYELKHIGELAAYIDRAGDADQFTMDRTDVIREKAEMMQKELEELEQEEESKAPVRVEEKVGRNDPCPCGSGLKYKKCCGK